MSVVQAPTTASPSAWDRFWFRPVPAARAEVFRRLCAGFVALDLLVIHSFLGQHGSDDAELYQPLLVGRVLPLPVPTDLVVWTVAFVVLGCSALTLTGRANRLVGVALALGYLQWLIIDFSYGKVDHDRFPIVLALFVLASLRPTSMHDRRSSTTAGWALRSVQVGVVSVYFLSAVAKVRYGFGGGSGTAATDSSSEDGERPLKSEGGGVGGGVEVIPVGFIKVNPGRDPLRLL